MLRKSERLPRLVFGDGVENVGGKRHSRDAKSALGDARRRKLVVQQSVRQQDEVDVKLGAACGTVEIRREEERGQRGCILRAVSGDEQSTGDVNADNDVEAFALQKRLECADDVLCGCGCAHLADAPADAVQVRHMAGRKGVSLL